MERTKDVVHPRFTICEFGFSTARFYVNGPGGEDYMLELEEDFTGYTGTIFRWDDELGGYVVIAQEERDEQSQLSALAHVMEFAATAMTGKLDHLEELPSDETGQLDRSLD